MAALIRCVVVVLLVFAWALPAQAHDLKPGAIAFRQLDSGYFSLRVTPPQDGSGATLELVPELPEGCTYEAEGIACKRDLVGLVRLPTLATRQVKVLVFVRWRDGRVFEHLLREGDAQVRIIRPRTEGVVRHNYLILGIEHILFGFDHLLFVLGLALVARHPRRVVVAVSGFTLAHSITLTLSALGWVRTPSAATELVIAASILLLAGEAARGQRGWTHRYPWLVALVFGLIHGFGFAGALASIGLPEDDLVWALLAFNLGVELGQMMVLALATAVAVLVVSLLSNHHRPLLRRVCAYALGLPAGVWVVGRMATWASL